MKLLSLFAAIIFTAFTGMAQSTCATSFKVNNGNGTCGAAGELRLTFPGGCPALVPVIDSVLINGVKSNVRFALPDASKCGGANGYISYCVTSGNMPPANVWNIFFRDAQGVFNCTVVSSTTNVLAVKFLSFDAALVGNSVACKWSVSEETVNNHYELERSYDGKTFASIAYIFSQENSPATKNDYSFIDKSATSQSKKMAFYRVKEVDQQGRISYSGVMSVKLAASAANSITTTPNPFKETISVAFQSSLVGKGEVKLVNMTGQPVGYKTTTINKGTNTVQLENLGSLPTGIYVAQLSINGVFAGNQKLVKN
ncbi:MAG: T9SS type A sorting domain-containing protein [Bacteroidota bacterium]